MFTPGRITHIDARKPLTPADVAAIEKSMDDHAVTVLPNQDIDDAQQLAFTTNFGPFQDGANSTERRDELRLDPPAVDELLDRRRHVALGDVVCDGLAFEVHPRSWL